MIQIKRNNKVFFTLEDFGEGSKLSYQLMDHHYIILKFTTAAPIYFEIGDSVEIPDFGYFELTSSYFPKHNDSDGYDYEMQMDAYYMSWKNKLCKYRPQHGANETSFNLTTTVGVHMNVILGNLKALGLTYNGKEFSVDYTTYNNKAFDVQKRFLIEYGSISILDALNAICSEDALNCEWWIDGSIIYLGYCEMEGQTTFEQDVNVLSMSYSESKSTYITRLYAFGSDRNIPKGYFTGADADVTTDGVATDYLMLPNKEVDSDGFYAKDGYLENVNVVKNDKQAIEGVVMFEEEYPKVESVVSSIKTYDSTVDNEDGTKTTQTFWQVTSTDSFTNNFKESWIKSNLTLGIKFTSGALMGMEFEVSFKVIDKANYFEIVANDTYGRTLPDGIMCPKVGDKYFLYNWDATKITDTDLIPTAQLSLFDRAKQYYQKTMISNSNFTCTMDGDKFYNDGTYDYHPLGEQVKLINDMFAQVDADGKHYRNSRIIGMEIPLDIPYDHPQYTVGEKAATSRLGKLEDKVDSIKVNGMQIGGTGSGNGGVYVIGLNDSTPASDSNVYSARRSRMEFVSRLQDNTAKGTITWEKIQKLLSGLLVGNHNNENGGSWTLDAEGRSHLITDYLEVRMKAIFEELVIKKTSTIGGKEIISPAGGVVAHKVEDVTVTYNNVSQKAYRCYFLAEQEGDSVDNDFALEDQVRSESFNVRKGTYHKVGNHFYWRLVIGRDEDPVELEGKKYHYIDLSDTDCATASDVPAKGDVLSQCGNRTDVERQNCLIFSAVDTYSPSVSLYHGINSYSFANKEYVEYGVNKQTNKAFFYVYGDMYVGDRPTKENNYEGSSYIKYDSATKQVSVKGKISAKSTVDGKELSQYIKENSAKGLTEEQVNNIINNSQVITDLQNQVDGAIETWFYEGVPTLKNAPASSWTTDKDKDTHLGDLYYDNKTGKAYRFAKDGNAYKWTIITDTDIAKALSDASKAQETADGKMKVFSTQPNPPYQVGDIWVNATYPSDGSTYKNEVLRCQTKKAAGSLFAIGDWIKASKYTDDTVANAAKAAAEKAQKAAETAQTNVTNLDETVTSNKKAFDSYVTDGYLEPSEIAAMAQDSKRLEDDFAAAEKSYNEVKGAEVLKSTKELTDLTSAFSTLSTAKKELIEYLSDISARYNAADTKGKATIVSAVGTKFSNFQSAYSAFYDKLGLANAYITSKIYGDLGVVIGDVATYQYLKKVLADGVETEINGGLILTSLIALRDPETKRVESGINGVIDKTAKGNGIATWWGGYMNDGEVVGFDKKDDYSKQAATSLVRFDGSGYLANGAIWWGTDGRVHADPTSFIISEKNLGAYLTFFEPTWKSGSAGTSVADLVSLKPNAPFSKLGVSGDATFEGAITFHGISITYDATNKAIKIDGNLYATGGITAYGAGTSTSTGGGLNGSVKSYADALKLTSESLSEVASAYSIKALSSRIDNISTELGGLSLSWNNITGKPSTFAPSAHTHKWADITDRITKVSQLTNDAGYLTAHQSLASYYTKTEIDAKGYTTNKGTVTSVALTLPTGLECATKTITTSGTFAISLASGYSIPTTTKQTAWDSAYDWYVLMTTDEETADGIINKWNEVVSFLANIAQTDTLSGIVDGINKSISDEVTRAKKAEGLNASGISTNKANITTLQGYFTNGSAKKALQLTNARKLWGNSFNGTSDIDGSIIVPDGKYISIGNIKMEYDATNKALKITNTTTNEVANLYTSGGVSAYGVGTSSSSGGGLNGSVKSYSDALKLASESLSEIASAYSIKQLSTRITSLEGGSATSISVSGSGNAVTSITKNGTTISVVKGSTFLTSHQSLSAYLKSADAANTYLKLSGGAMTGNIRYKGSNSTYDMITFVDNNVDTYGNGICIGGGGLTIIGGGESAYSVLDQQTYGGDEKMIVANDAAIDFFSNVQAGWDSRKVGSFDTSGYWHGAGFKKDDSSDSYVLLGGGGHKAISSLSVNYANSAGSANSVAWSNVSGRPTKVSQFTNDSGYITSSASITGNAATATKLATARNIALGYDFRGSANFDGTGNITINGHINAAIISIGSTDPSPFKRIAHVQVPGSWNDNALLLYLSQGYHGGSFGICRVEFRTNNVSEAGNAAASVKWLFRYGYDTDYVQVGFYSAKNNSYMDVFVKTTGSYQGTVIRCLQDSRGDINSNVSLLKATATTEAYTSIEAAATALYKLAYTAIVKGSDAGAVNYANSAGNAGTLDGIHANGLFTNLSNNGNNLSITIGGTNKTLTVGYATKAAQLNTARTLWGQSFDGTGDVNGTLTNTNSTGAETIIRCSNTYGQIDLLTSVNRGVYDRTKTRWLIATNGANSFLDCGNVGIGTFAPAYKLDVSGDARATNFRGALVGNAATATKLQTARTIWGNSFNGTSDVNGSIIVPDGKYISIGNIKMEYDATNKALKITNTTTNEVANLYTSGGVSAYGVGTSSSSGGGLNGSVKSYSDALKLASESLSEIASAYSIKQLSTRITSLEGGSATSISVSGSGNAVTSITKNGTTISVVKGSTFLTSHQSLDGYVNNITTSGTGNAITSVTKSGKTVTFTKGATFLTSHQSLSAYLKSADAANTYSRIGHTHSQYLTSHQSFTDLCATLPVGDGVFTDDTEIITSYNRGGFSNVNALNKPFKRKAILLWMYIKDNANTIYQPKGNYLTSHQDISGKVNKSGDTMTGDLSFSVPSGNSQTLYFKRGVNTSWGINVEEGNMKFRELTSNKVAFSIYENSQGATAYIYGQGIIHSGNIGSQTVLSAKKLQTTRSLWGNSFDGTNDIGGTILPSATHKYNLGSATYMFEKTYTRYIDTDSDYDLRLLCAGSEVLRLGATDKSVNINYDASILGRTIIANGLDVYNKNSHFCSVVITEFAASTNGGSINVIDTSGGAPNRRPLALQYGQGNVGIGTLTPSEKLEVSGNILATGGITAYSSSDIRLKQDLRKLDFFGIVKAMGGTYGFAWKKDNTRSIGWIAQHVLCNPYLRDIVETDENGYYKINYWSPKLIATAFGAIEQVGDEVSRIKARVVFLESEVQRLSGKQDGSDKKRLGNKNIKSLN